MIEIFRENENSQKGSKNGRKNFERAILREIEEETVLNQYNIYGR